MGVFWIRLTWFASVVLAGVVPQPGAASAAAGDVADAVSGDVAEIIDAELRRHPGGTVVGDEIQYADGVTFVAVEAGVYSLSQCGSGKFCGWTSPGYTGSLYYTSGSGVTKSLTWAAKSYSNNRAKGARLYNSAGSASLCFTPGQDRASVGSGYHSPSKVYLSTTTSC